MTRRLTAAASLAALSVVHVAWAEGSPFPCRDRTSLANAVIGQDEMPGADPTKAIAGVLAGAALVVALGRPRAARRLVAGVLVARGVVGLVRPDLLPAGPREPFPTLNRRVYSPLALALGLASL